jgi:hypothetical protein
MVPTAGCIWECGGGALVQVGLLNSLFNRKQVAQGFFQFASLFTIPIAGGKFNQPPLD